MMSKPHKGLIKDWYRYYLNDTNYLIEGMFIDHPDFAGKFGHTSRIISHNENTGEVETLNSRYTLVGESKKPEMNLGEYNEFLKESIKDLEDQGFKFEGWI